MFSEYLICIYCEPLKALLNAQSSWVVVVHSFNPSTQRQRQADLYEFKPSLVYRVSSRTGSKATEKSCLEKQTNKQQQQQKILSLSHSPSVAVGNLSLDLESNKEEFFGKIKL